MRMSNNRLYSFQSFSQEDNRKPERKSRSRGDPVDWDHNIMSVTNCFLIKALLNGTKTFNYN